MPRHHTLRSLHPTRPPNYPPSSNLLSLILTTATSSSPPCSPPLPYSDSPSSASSPSRTSPSSYPDSSSPPSAASPFTLSPNNPCIEQSTASQLLHWPRVPRMMPGDEDAVLLLLFLCDLQHRFLQVLDEASPSEWRHILKDLCYNTIVSLSGISSHHRGALVPYVETVVRCHRYGSTM